jgi:hypothetical protein
MSASQSEWSELLCEFIECILICLILVSDVKFAAQNSAQFYGQSAIICHCVTFILGKIRYGPKWLPPLDSHSERLSRQIKNQGFRE